MILRRNNVDIEWDNEWNEGERLCRGEERGLGGGSKIKFAQNGLKYILVLEFWNPMKFRNCNFIVTDHGQPTNPLEGQIP